MQGFVGYVIQINGYSPEEVIMLHTNVPMILWRKTLSITQTSSLMRFFFEVCDLSIGAYTKE